MVNFELTNTPNELISQKPVIQPHLIDVYSNFKSKEERQKKKAQRKEKRAAKKERRIEKRKIAKEERKGMGVGKRLLNLSQKANPAAIVPRSSFLLALRINLFGISRRLYPAVLTDEEIKKKGLDPENAKKAKEVIEKKFAPVWLAMGGRKISLYENIKKGFDKPVFKTKKIKQAKKDIKASEERVASKKSSFDGDYNDNTLYHPHRVAGGLYQLYATKPVVEPFHNFDSNELDLGIDGTGNMDLSEMRSNNDCVACSSIEGDGDLSHATYLNANGDLREAEIIDSISSEKYSNYVEEAAIAGYITAGLSIVGSLVGMLNKGGVSKNPYKKGTPEYAAVEKSNQEAEKEGDMTAPPADEAALNKIKEAAADDAKKGISEQEIAKEEAQVQKEVSKDLGVEDDKILGMPKPVFFIGLAVLAIGGILIAKKMMNKGASAPTKL